MRKPLVYMVAAAVAVTGALTGVAPASASMAGMAAPLAQTAERAAPGVEKVGWKKRGRYYRGGRHYRGGRYYRGGRRHYSRRYYRNHRRSNAGAAVAAGIIGLAAGAIISGSANRGSNWHAYCASKYRSYDPRSGTYLGYDGYRHPCR